MGAQDIVFYSGIAAFVVAGIFAILAARTFFVQDIRGVMADLSGKARGGTRGGARVGATGGGVSRPRRTQRRRSQDGADIGDASLPVPEAPPINTTSEDGIDTILDTSLKEARRTTMGISNDNRNVNDDMPTLVTSMAGYPQVSDAVNEDGSELPTAVEGAGNTRFGAFRVTRSIVAISSNEVISVVD